MKLVAGRDTSTERISVFAKRMPLPDLLSNVATLYGWEWSSEKGSAGSADVLTLGASKQFKVWGQRQWDAMAENAFLPVAARAQAERETSAAREQSTLEAFQAAVTPEQREQRELDYLHAIAQTAAIQFSATLTRFEKRQLVAQERLYLPWARLTPRQRELITTVSLPTQFYKSYFSGDLMDDDKTTKEEREEFARELTSRLNRTGVMLSVKMEPVTGVVLRLGTGGASLPDQPRLPDADGLKKFEETMPPVRGNPYPMLDAKSSTEQKDSLERPAAAVSGTEYAELERTPFPDKLQLVPSDTWGSVVSKLSKVVDRPIFSDGYTAARAIRPTINTDGSRIAPLSPPADDLLARSGSLASGLDLLCRAYNMVWWEQSGALFFRSRTWLSERRYETLPATRARLIANIRNLPFQNAKGKNAAALLQTLGDLTLQQLQGLTTTGKPGEEVDYYISKGDSLQESATVYQFLGFLRHLAADQQLAVVTKGGLALEVATQEQQAVLVNLVGWRTVTGAFPPLVSAQLTRQRVLTGGGSEAQACAALLQVWFTKDPNKAPFNFIVVLADEQPPTAKNAKGDP